MKKFFSIILLVFVYFSAYAINPAKLLTPIPSDFKPECYKYYKKVKMTNIFWYGDTYKLLVNKKDLIITHFWFLLPYKRLDDNTIVIKRFYDSYVELYSGYGCSWSFDTKPKEYSSFSFNNGTRIIDAKLSKNPKYGIYNKKDFDNDWVEDKKDNCPYRYNPLQTDTNKDSVWDACMDDDKDTIIWIFDNCPNVFNPAQEDSNGNGVWDVCEFDKDKDGVLDLKDNCPNISNPDQKDSDKDWVWDVCDNCKYYNPAQLDYNKDWIGDICKIINDKKILKKKQLKQKMLNKEILKKDKDRDNVLDKKDNCPSKYNPDQKDIDSDWIWDVCDKKDDRFSQTHKWLFKYILFIISISVTGGIFYKFWRKKS